MNAFAEIVAAVQPTPRVRMLTHELRVADFAHPDRVPCESVQVLADALTPLANEVFERDMSGYWRGEVFSDVFQQRARFFLLGNSHGELVGWSGYWRVPSDVPCLFFDVTAMRSDVQGGRVATRVYIRALAREFARHPLRTLYLTGHTQNPVVYAMQQRAMGEFNVYPRHGAPIPPRIREVADSVAKWSMNWLRATGLEQPMAFDADTLVLRGAYPHSIHGGGRPSSGDDTIDSWFVDLLRDEDCLVFVSEASIRHLFNVRRAVRARRQARKDTILGGP